MALLQSGPFVLSNKDLSINFWAMAAEENRRVTIYINGKEVEFSLKGISAEMRKTRNELRSMTLGTEEYNKKAKELKNIEGIYKRQTDALKGTSTQTGILGNAMGGLKSMVGSLLSPVGLITAGFGAAFAAIGDGVQIIKRTEKALDDLQAITGLNADEMGFFRNKAIEFAKAFGEAPDKILEAFKLAGSARPELLESKDAMVGFTEAALTLAKASGMEVGPAIESLTTIMNANGAKSEEVGRYINVLAAGSQKGAKEVDFLAKAFEKIGPVGATAGLTIEQQTAALELLGEKGFNSAETAGTNFRNILLILQQDQANMTNGLLDMNKVFDNYGPIATNAAELTNVFGRENVAAAQSILINQGRLSELTESITGTNTAYEQSAIQMDNMDGKLSKMSAQWDSLWASMESGDSVISKVIEAATWAIGEVEKTFTRISAVISIVSSIGGGNKGSDNSQQLADQQKAIDTYYATTFKGEVEKYAIAGKIDALHKAHVEDLRKMDQSSEDYKRAMRELTVIEEVRNFELEKQIKAKQEIADKDRDNLNASKAKLDNEKALTKAAEDRIKAEKRKMSEANAKEGISPIAMRGIEGEIQFTRDVEAAKTAVIMDASAARTQMQEEMQKAAFEREVKLAQQHEAEVAAARESIVKTTVDTAFALAAVSSDKRKNRELKNLESQKEQGLITEQKYEAQKEAIEREAFQRKKRLDIAEATVNGIVAGTKTLAQLGWPAALPALIALGAQTAGQIALIAAQEYGDGGMVYGASHANGGVPIVAEGGEYMVKNKEVTPETLPILEAINSGQIRFLNANKAADNTRADSSGILRNNVSRSLSTSSNNGSQMIVDELKRFNRELEVKLPLRSLEKATDRRTRIEKLAKVA